MKRALISGISGQCGSYLAELLLEKGFDVHGTARRVAVDEEQRFKNIAHILPSITIHSAVIENYQSIYNVIEDVQPTEIYHLAAQSFVMDSFLDEFTTLKTNVWGIHNVLCAVHRLLPSCRVYFAGSSEMFGDVLETPQRENTPFNPRSVYGISKCTGFQMSKHYRGAHGVHVSSGILFNNESPRRTPHFVTRKIARAAARIKLGVEKELVLGNLDPQRDWGHSKDYVRAMFLMLQQDSPDDYVVASGRTRSVHDFCRAAFNVVGLNCDDYIRLDQQFVRPSEVNLLLGDASKARRVLGWEPTITFEELVREMVESELEASKK